MEETFRSTVKRLFFGVAVENSLRKRIPVAVSGDETRSYRRFSRLLAVLFNVFEAVAFSQLRRGFLSGL